MTALPARPSSRPPLWRRALPALFGALALSALPPALAAAPAEIASKACAPCHGLDGNSVEPLYPKLAGQTAAYTAKQISEFVMGSRGHEPAAAVSQLTPLETEALATYYSQQPTSPGKPGEPTLTKIGQLLYTIGNPKTGLPSCDGCHSADASGGGRFPRLAGQHREYLVKQLNDIRAGRRNSSSLMRAVADRMGDLEIKAMTVYLSGL